MKLLEKQNNHERCASLVLETIPLLMCVIRSEIRKRRPAELSVPQFRVLAYLRRHEGASLSDLADHSGLTLPTMSKMVEGLVERGLVRREASHSDRRRVMLGLTRQGRTVFDSAAQGARMRIGELLSKLSAEEQMTIIRAMEKLRFIVDEK
ncbi:MAG: MarR family transcriptional regulator [Armatimonadota bacterium]|nr:MarR family transcriptional regulator [Armatimonadota bacterium]